MSAPRLVVVYRTFGLVMGMKIPWQTALGVVFISGVIFFVLSFTNFRIWVIKSIPLDLRRAISAGMGGWVRSPQARTDAE